MLGLRFFSNSRPLDEWLSLEQESEAKALAAGDRDNAGQRAIGSAGFTFYARRRTRCWPVVTVRQRTGTQPRPAPASAPTHSPARHRHQLKKDYTAAITAYREALDLWRSLSTESVEVALT